MPGRAPRPPRDADLLARAERAERAGDMVAAATALRAVVEEHPDDAATRLRFARALVAAGERPAARRALEAFDGGPPPPLELAADVHRARAALDEADGAVAAAIDRWERVLAYDLDDAEALARLRALRPHAPAASASAAETLVSPEGLEALRYRLRRELGRGATAAVYLATDETLGIDVALKVLHPQLASAARADARRRFFAEGRLAAALRHPGVIAIYDVDERARVLAMEYVAGGTLRARLAARDGAALPQGEPRGDGGVAARDARARPRARHRPRRSQAVEPAAARARRRRARRLRQRRAARRRAHRGRRRRGHAAVPRARAAARRAPSPASDLYAAGAILWEAGAGRPLRTHADLLRGALDNPPLPPEARAAFGPRLAALVTALVAPAPTSRPPSADAARAGHS